MAEQLILAGSYTASFPYAGRLRRLLARLAGRGRAVRPPVHLLAFDPATGKLRVKAALEGIENASWLALHPGGRCTYAVSEATPGRVNTVAVDGERSSLQLLTSRPCGGDRPCFAAVDPTGRRLYVANYATGSISLHPIDDRGRAGDSTQVVRQKGSGPDRRRQRSSHPHAVVLSPDGRFALVPDLGADRIFIYAIDAATGRLTAHSTPFAAVEPGAGPRQAVFGSTSRFLYVLNELSSTVASFAWDPGAGALTPCAVLSALPEGWAGHSTAAHIAVHPNGPFLYVSNRGHDGIVMFTATPDGRLRIIGGVPSGGRTPRHFAIDPSGRFLLAAHQDSDLVTTFAIDPETGLLSELAASAVPACVCLQYLPPA